MKPLIVSFFLFILAYSLIVDKEEKRIEVIEQSPTSIQISNPDQAIKPDSIELIAEKLYYTVPE